MGIILMPEVKDRMSLAARRSSFLGRLDPSLSSRYTWVTPLRIDVSRSLSRAGRRADQFKRRAFYTIVAILAVLVVRFVWDLVWTVLDTGNISVCLMMPHVGDGMNDSQEKSSKKYVLGENCKSSGRQNSYRHLTGHKNSEKMICRIPLLIILTSHVCAATFVVNVTQSSYQTEGNHNITLEWTFTPNPGPSSSPPDIYCDFTNHLGVSAVFYMFDGVDILKYQHEQFAGRVQSERDALREGRLRLHMSGLRTEDSGQYWCRLDTEFGGGSASCEVLVSAAGQLQPQKPAVTARPESDERNSLYTEIIGGGAVLIVCFGVWYSVIFKKHLILEAFTRCKDNIFRFHLKTACHNPSCSASSPLRTCSPEHQRSSREQLN
ncbi:uncharacterized protein LOC133420487 [Cololabis saira]|uniref:uncharacterized protein LOC133420487 n=1 Tax=Cololabis saira TaxID=129043 RepID=UPI002AD454A2|nr:uncharacterized protein LOC133420487 [Cololabis saira]